MGQAGPTARCCVDRLACVELHGLPLQILLRRHPRWAELPAVVVAEDRPQAPVLWVNEHARGQRILTGMRYAEALSLCQELRAGAVAEDEVRQTVDQLTTLLRGHSPEVEPAATEPGVFWLNAAGLRRMFSSLERWARGVVSAVEQRGLRCRVVVGFSRFGTYALARTGQQPMRCLHRPEQEVALTRAVPLARLTVDPGLRDALDRLGVRTVADFLGLPAGAVLERFGAEARRLHAMAEGSLWAPLQAQAEVPLVAREVDLEYRETDLTRLLFLIKRQLDPMLTQLERRHEKLRVLLLTLHFEDRTEVEHSVRPASPTLDGRQLLDLVRLRLESRGLGTPVCRLALSALPQQATADQLQLFAQRPRRDLEAANRALARLRAELGNGAVTLAVVQPRHLPEARVRWEPLQQLGRPKAASEVGPRRLIRRLLDEPREVAPQTVPLLQDRGGPHVVSGGWWQREVHRQYHFVQHPDGRLLWVFFDAHRQRWMIHGSVE